MGVFFRDNMNIPAEAVISLFIYIVASTVGFIWWMATQTITLQFVREDLAKANKILLGFETMYATKIELSKVETSVDKAHERIDMITSNHKG